MLQTDRQTTQCTKGLTDNTVGQKPWLCFPGRAGPVFRLDRGLHMQINQQTAAITLYKLQQCQQETLAIADKPVQRFW